MEVCGCGDDAAVCVSVAFDCDYCFHGESACVNVSGEGGDCGVVMVGRGCDGVLKVSHHSLLLLCLPSVHRQQPSTFSSMNQSVTMMMGAHLRIF